MLPRSRSILPPSRSPPPGTTALFDHACIHYNIPMSDSLIIAGRSFRSRLIVGTGKYKSFQETARALEASGAEMVTVAVRRVNLDRSKESLLDYIDPRNTSCSPTPPDATPLTKPSAPLDWAAKSDFRTGSSSK